MKTIIYLLFITIGYGFADEVWDEIIDQAIEAATEEIINKHLDIVQIPDVDRHINEKILGIPVELDVKLRGMEFWNTTSLRRKSPSEVLQDDTTGNITFATAFGLDDFHVAIKNVYVHVIGINIDGQFNAECDSNALDFSLSVITDSTGKCEASVNWARISSFEKFTLKLTPSGFINWIAQHLASFILNNFNSKIVNFVNDGLPEVLNSAVKQIDVCRYLPIG